MYHIKVCFSGNEEHEKVNDFLLGWKHWKIVIGYACILARITERGVPFPAAKRLALCGGEEACPLPRCRRLPLACGKGIALPCIADDFP